MKILALVSSYRKRGNTVRMVEMVAHKLHQLTALQALPLEVETLNIAHMNIQTCRGCRVCFNQGEFRCPLKDDLLSIRSKIRDADVLILASPVYVEDVNGIMKNWIDRMAFVCHRPEFAGKYAYTLTTSGVGSTTHALRTMNTALKMWGFYLIGKSKLKAGAYLPQEELQAKYQEEAHRIATNILKAVQNQRATRPSFLSLMTFKIQQRFYLQENTDSYDLTYWRERKWLEKNQEFYIPHQSSRLKAQIAQISGSVLARFVL